MNQQASTARRMNYSGMTILILLIALAIRLYLMPLPGNSSDTGLFARWCLTSTETGISSVYPKTSSDYPPGIFYILKSIGLFYQHFFSPTLEYTPTLRMLLKIPAVAADLITASMLFFFLRKWKSERVAFWCFTLYALNPAVIYDSAYWGQVDALNTLFMLAAILLLMRRKLEGSWTMLTIALLIKLHAIVLAPVILLVSLKNYSWKRLLKAVLLSLFVAFIILFPFVYDGQLQQVENVYTNAVGSYSYISVNAFNIWWLLQPLKVQNMEVPYLEGKNDEQPVIDGITYKRLGLFFLGAFTLLTLFVLTRNNDPHVIAFLSFAMVFAFFMLPTEIHERYLFPAFALLSIVCLSEKKLIIMYGFLTLTFLVNLQVLPFSDPFSMLLTKIISLPTMIPFFSSITAFLNVLIFCYMLFVIMVKLLKRNNEFLMRSPADKCRSF
jgi:Gpi18-like mannosyltransferase